MREKLDKIPFALRKQVTTQSAIGVFCLLLSLWIFLLERHVLVCFPCVTVAVVLIINSMILLYRSLTETYLCLEGVCSHIETVGFRKRIQSVCLSLEQGTLRIPVHRRFQNLTVGDELAIYLSVKAPVYEQDGDFVVCSYYALERRKINV